MGTITSALSTNHSATRCCHGVSPSPAFVSGGFAYFAGSGTSVSTLNKVNLATFQAVGAFPLPTPSKDAVLLLRLPPGAYTVHLQGRTAQSGIGLLELYALPD